MATRRKWLMQTVGLAVATAILALLAAPAPAAVFPAAIGRANLNGSDPDYIFITARASWLAADSAHLYWSNGRGYSIGRANLDGSGVDPRFIGIPTSDIDDHISGVAVDGKHVYWTATYWLNFSNKSIWRANLDGTRVDPWFIGGPGADPGGIAVDSGHIYWTNGNSIGRANLDGTGVDPWFIGGVRSGFAEPGLAIDATHIYWYTEDQHEATWIGRANLDGTGVEPRFIPVSCGGCGQASQVGPSQLAVGSGHIYWDGQYGIVRADLDGTGIDERFMPGTGGPLAVASGTLYWASPPRPGLRIRRNTHLWPSRGTATLQLDVPGPGSLVLKGRGLHKVSKAIGIGGGERLIVRARGAKRRRLERRGQVRVTANVTFTLAGADPQTKSKSLTLVKR